MMPALNDHRMGALNHLVEAASALAKLNTPGPPSLGRLPSEVISKTAQEGHGRSSPIVSDEEAESQNLKSATSSRSSKREIFPQRLMAILNDESLSDIVSWLPHGRSFVVLRPDVFTEKVLPKYLPPVDARSSTKYPSFTRKLNRWGFRQATRGPDTGAFHHPLFVRDQPELCLGMVCKRSSERKPGEQKQRTTEDHQCPRKPKKEDPSVEKKIAPLTKDALEAIASEETCKVAAATVSVTDDGRSDISSTTSEATSGMSRVPKEITSDVTLIQKSLQERDEQERLRVAKAMLYQNFLDALQSQ